MSFKQYIVTFDNCEKHDLKDELKSLGIEQVYVLSTIPGNFVRANLTDEEVEIVRQNDHVVDVFELPEAVPDNDELPKKAKVEAATPKFFFGLNTANSLSEIQSESTALRNLNLDINDIDKIRGIRSLGLDRNDLRTLSGLDFDLLPELASINESYKSAPSKILQTSSTDVYTQYSINVDGPYSSRGFKYNFFDVATAQNKVADISTSRVSSWSSFDDTDETTPIYYGGDVEIIPEPTTQKSTLSATQLTVTQEPKRRRFAAEIPTDLITLTIDGVEKQFYAMRGIPLQFTGTFRSLFTGQITHKIVQLTENDPLPTWTVENIEDGSIFEFEDLKVEDSIRYSDFRVKERQVSFYYPPAQIEALGLSGLFMREFPNVTIDNLKELNISRNDFIEMPSVSFIAPSLEILDVSDQNFMRSKNEKTARQQLASLPASLKEFTANAAFSSNYSTQNEVPDFSNLVNLEYIEFNATGLRSSLSLGEFITLPKFASNYVDHPVIDIIDMQPSKIYEIVSTGDWDRAKFYNLGFWYEGGISRFTENDNISRTELFDWVEAANLGLITPLIESPITNDGLVDASTSSNPTVRLVENDIPLKEVYFIGHDTSNDLSLDVKGRMVHSTVLDANKLEIVDIGTSSIKPKHVLDDALAMYLNYTNEWFTSVQSEFGNVEDGTGWVRNNSFSQGDRILIPTNGCESDRISSTVLTNYTSFENYVDHLPIFSNCVGLKELAYQKEVAEDTLTLYPYVTISGVSYGVGQRELDVNYRTMANEYLPLDGLRSLSKLTLSGLNTIFDLRTSFQNFPSLTALSVDACGTIQGFTSETFAGTPLLEDIEIRSSFIGHPDFLTKETLVVEIDGTYIKEADTVRVVTRGSSLSQLDITNVDATNLQSHTHHFSTNNYVTNDFGHENTENSQIANQAWKQQNLGENIDIVALEVGPGAPSSASYANHPDFLNESGVTRFVPMDWSNYSSAIDDSVNDQITNDVEFTPHSVGVLSAAGGVTGGLAKRASLRLIRSSGTDNILECLDAINAWHQSKPINAITGVRNPTIAIHAYGVPYDRWIQVPISTVSSIVPNSNTANTISRPVGGWTDFTPFIQNSLIPRYSTTIDDWVIASKFSDFNDAALIAAYDAGADIGVYHFSSGGNSSTSYAKANSSEAATYVNIDSGTNLPYKTGSDQFGRPIFGSTLISTTQFPLLPPAYKGSSKCFDVAAGHMSTKYPRLDPYSSRGPAMDIIGSGSETLTAYIHTQGQTDPRWVKDAFDNEYTWFSGTSCAAPTVAGGFACILERYFDVNGSYPSTYNAGFALLKNDARDWLINEQATDWTNPPAARSFTINSIDVNVGRVGSNVSSYLIDAPNTTTDLMFITDTVRYPDPAAIAEQRNYIMSTQDYDKHGFLDFNLQIQPVPAFTTDCLQNLPGLKSFAVEGIVVPVLVENDDPPPLFLEGAKGELPNFDNNENLEKLIIAHLSLEDATIPEFIVNEKLQIISIIETRIGGKMPALSLPALTSLGIIGTLIESDDTTDGQFPILNCRQLNSLTISSNKNISGPIRSLANCPFIERLDYQKNNFTSYTVGSFRSLAQCGDIRINDNNLSTQDIINILNDLYITYTVNPRKFVSFEARNNNATLQEVLQDPTALQNYTILTQIANWSISI